MPAGGGEGPVGTAFFLFSSSSLRTLWHIFVNTCCHRLLTAMAPFPFSAFSLFFPFFFYRLWCQSLLVFLFTALNQLCYALSFPHPFCVQHCSQTPFRLSFHVSFPSPQPSSRPPTPSILPCVADHYLADRAFFLFHMVCVVPCAALAFLKCKSRYIVM